MKKLQSLVLVLILVCSFVLVACNGDPQPLEAPKNLKISDSGLIQWDAVEGALGYVVTVGDQTYSTTTNSYQLQESQLQNSFRYSVKTVGPGNSISVSSAEETYVTKTPQPPKPVENISVSISGGTQIKSGGTLQLIANVSGTENMSVNWKVVSGGEYISVDVTGLVTAKEVSAPQKASVEARSVADPTKVAVRELEIGVKPVLTQAMLNELNTDKISFTGWVEVTYYKVDIYESLAGTNSMTVFTAMDGERWHTTFINNSGVYSTINAANHNGYAAMIGVSLMNEELYEVMTDDNGTELTWADSGYYNNLKNLRVDDFVLNEDTWYFDYKYKNDGRPEKLLAAADPYDFLVDGFSLIVNGDVIDGVYAKSLDDYTIQGGYRCVQELTVAISLGEEVTIPEVAKFKLDPLQQPLVEALQNMHNLTSFTMDYKNIQSLMNGTPSTSYVYETITPSVCYFVPYEITGIIQGEEVRKYHEDSAYGYLAIDNSVEHPLYNTFVSDNGNFVAGRAYNASFNNCKPTFNFAPEIFTQVGAVDADGNQVFLVNDAMMSVASELYNGLGTDDELYGIYATNRDIVMQTEYFNPYVIVNNGYIVEAGFYYDMIDIKGIVQVNFGNFNSATLPQSVSFEGFETRHVPTSWSELEFVQRNDNNTETMVNAQTYFADTLHLDDVAFIGNVLGDAFGFGIIDYHKPGGVAYNVPAVTMFYDVSLDLDYSLTKSIKAVETYLISLGYTKNAYGEFHKGDVAIALQDNNLLLYIHVWNSNPQTHA